MKKIYSDGITRPCLKNKTCIKNLKMIKQKWEEIFHTLSSDADMENLSIDSTMAKAHQSTNGGFKKGRKNPLEEPVED